MFIESRITRALLYFIFNLSASIPLLLFNLSQAKKKRTFLSNASQLAIDAYSKKNPATRFVRAMSNPNFLAIAEMVAISFVQYLPVTPITRTFGGITYTGTNYFGFVYFIPLVLILYCALVGTDVLRQIDLITPSFPLALAFSKIACFFFGCCYGMECSYGLYNYQTKRVELPIQLIELLIALAIFAFILLLRKRAKVGTLYPIYVIVYSSTRFFSEFLRGEENIFFIFKKYHIFCIIGLIVGVIELVVVLKFGDIIIERCSGVFPLMLTRFGKKKNKNKKKNTVHHKKKKK